MAQLPHIDIVGSGPALVLIHGWGLHSGVFAPLTERLSGQFRIHLVDLPGHGKSRASTRIEWPGLVDGLMEAIPENAIWAGWSLGGLFALDAALRHADRVRGLAMLASSPCFVIKADWPLGVSRSVFEQFATGLETRFQATVERFFALEAMGSTGVADTLQHLRTIAFAHDPPARESLYDGLMLLESIDKRTGLPGLSVPSVWIAGRRDRMIPAAAMQWAAGTAPDARFVELDSGHMPFVSRTDEVAGALIGLASD